MTVQVAPAVSGRATGVMNNLEDVHGSWPGYQHVYPVRVQMLMQLQSRVNACCMATAKFLNDRHKTNVDISEN